MRVVSNTAVSLDGKIALASGEFVRLGSASDLRRLRDLRAEVDAVLVGGQTFRVFPFPMRSRDPAAARPRWNAVLTRGGLLGPDGPTAEGWEARWRTSGQPLLVLGPTGLDPAPYRERLGAEVETTAAPGPRWALDALAARGCESVQLECGGSLLFEFAEADLLDELYVTLCPWLVGGAQAPTLLDGAGLTREGLRRLRLLLVRQEGDEIMLHYCKY